MILKEKYWYRLFEAGILIKVINGTWEIISGFVLVFLTRAALNSALLFMFRGELIEDPQDKLFHFLNTQMQFFSFRARDFAIIYLLFHGFLNIFLAYNLYLKRLWAYVVSIIFGSIFVLYFIHLFGRTHSLILFGLIVFDTIFMILTWHEYRYRLKSLKKVAA